MTDSAKGPAAGYIFQFEIALYELSQLNINEKISIEKVDDVAKEDHTGTYLSTVQTKHSIVSGETNFGNTSVDLWKTLIIWINKLKDGILNEKTEFIAITNRSIPKNSIIKSFGVDFKLLLKTIQKIEADQEEKLKQKHQSGKAAKTIALTIKRIKYVVENQDFFKIISENFKILEHESPKIKFLNNLHLANASNLIQNDYYERFLGWIISRSKENWNNNSEAIFSKSDFADRYNLIRDQHPLKQAIFRTKKSLQNTHSVNIGEIDKSAFFIRQIEDINRNELDKIDIIEEAVVNFIFCQNEIAYLITERNIITSLDYKDFQDKCLNEWKKIKRHLAPLNISSYTSDQLNDIAIQIFDQIMDNVKIDFSESISFNDSNRYIQSGTFIWLSNIPILGWHPDWSNKYKN